MHPAEQSKSQQHNVGKAEKDALRRLYQRNRYARLTQEQRQQVVDKASRNKKRKHQASTPDVCPNLDNQGRNTTSSQTLHPASDAYEDAGNQPSLRLSTLYELRKVQPCRHCGATRLQHEPPSFCCAMGKVVLSSSAVPDALYFMFTSCESDAEEFRRHIRAYNSIFSFTSFRANVDTDLATSRQGVYTFRAQGQIYHSLPPLVPSENGPNFFQLYFYDTDNEIQNRMSVINEAYLNESVIEKLIDVMTRNPYANFLRTLENYPMDNYAIRIRSDVKLDQRVYNAPTSDQVAAIWIEGNNPSEPQERDIIVHSTSGQRHKVRHYYGCYDPLQYPILFPYGEVGWHQNIFKRNNLEGTTNGVTTESTSNCNSFTSAEDIFRNEQEGVEVGSSNKVSCREFYSYKLQIRDRERSTLLLSRRLLQQYIVDMYIKLETTRLDYFRNQQSHIRAELYQGIVDSVMAGENRGQMVGKRIVLPASFVGGPRDMRKRYLDAISLVSKYGKPDLFITMTCNPDWKEIKALLQNGQIPQDRPDLCARAFRAKLQDLKEQLFTKQIFGEVAAHVHVIEFQKRGLPHVHLLIILKAANKITSAEQFDQFACAEIPDPCQYPELHEKVVKHMMHGPCGDLNPKNVCMTDIGCKNHYPRAYSSETLQGRNSYPIYRRRANGVTVVVRNTLLDNRWVVPYNPYLLSRYDCHINVEICSGVKAVKYLYKYIYKGHDKVAVHIHQQHGEEVADEIHQFQDARWVAAPEAIWRIFGFHLNEIYPAVINLQLHLPNKQCISYWEHQRLDNILHNDLTPMTMLTEFFNYCLNDKDKADYLYKDFPEKFTWNKQRRSWTPRGHKKVIGRINAANPSEGERYYLRLLLNHVRRPTSFEDLLTCDGAKCQSFKEAAEKRGLMQTDDWIFHCLSDAISFQMPSALRRLFATLLVFCEPANVKLLWDQFYDDLSDDLVRRETITPEARLHKTLQGVDYFLQSMGKSIKDYDLPIPKEGPIGSEVLRKREVLDEMAIETPSIDIQSVSSLNAEQRIAYDLILKHVNQMRPGVFFIDGPGGTGKTFLYRALLATIRAMKKICIATATSGVAASIMPGGRTAHSRFKISIDGDEAGMCNISKQSGTADLLQKASLIIWDEAPMAKRWDIESVDRSLRDILSNNALFGGKVVVFGGDFRQVLPVIPRGTRAESVNASLAKSYLWPHMHKLKLTKNMRALDDQSFSDFLLRVGNGDEPTTNEDLIELPPEMVINYGQKPSPESCMIDTIFPALKENAHSPHYITERAILATRNECVDLLNQKLIASFPGEAWRYTSYDKAVDDTHNYYPEEFLNTLTPNGLPPHELVLKVNSPIMLLRNLSHSEGLCNGTRMVCKSFKKNIIHAEITLGQYAGKDVFLHRIPLFPPKNEAFPFQFQRMQFPIRLCFAMTINKSQGQTIPYVGVYLPQHVFSHGQLYVALSRGTSMSTTKVLVQRRTTNRKKGAHTKNIVYKEVLTS